MVKLMLFIALIVVLAVLRWRFDRNYTMPAIAESSKLTVLNRLAYGMVAGIMLSIVFRNYTVLVISLVIGIPFLLYINLKTFQAALRKFLKK